MGIVAEMLKSGGTEVEKALLDLYNEAIKPGAAIPSKWKETIAKTNGSMIGKTSLRVSSAMFSAISDAW